jgi:hypothetical protein
MNKLILPVGIGVGIWFLLRKASFVGGLNVLVNKINFSGGLFSPMVNVSFKVQNPTNNRSKISAIVGNVFYKGQAIASVSNFETQEIKARSETVLNITARPTALGIIKTLVDLIKNKQKLDGSFKFIGSINADGIVFQIDQGYNL